MNSLLNVIYHKCFTVHVKHHILAAGDDAVIIVEAGDVDTVVRQIQSLTFAEKATSLTKKGLGQVIKRAVVTQSKFEMLSLNFLTLGNCTVQASRFIGRIVNTSGSIQVDVDKPPDFIRDAITNNLKAEGMCADGQYKHTYRSWCGKRP
jgi:hypothetical protein